MYILRTRNIPEVGKKYVRIYFLEMEKLKNMENFMEENLKNMQVLENVEKVSLDKNDIKNENKQEKLIFGKNNFWLKKC